MNKGKIYPVLFISLFATILLIDQAFALRITPVPNVWKHMKKPIVTDPDLQHYVNNLLRSMPEEEKIGNGGTSDAVRYEIVTGSSVKGKFHSQKTREYIIALRHWLKRHKNDIPSDQSFAHYIQLDLQDALNTDQYDKAVLDELFPKKQPAKTRTETQHKARAA